MKEKHANSKFPWTLAQLKDILKRHGKSCFHFEEFIVKTNFGNYKVYEELFNIKNYEQFLIVMANIIKEGHISAYALAIYRQQLTKKFLSKIIDTYIRKNLFSEPFDPYIDKNWQVLMIAQVGIIAHIIKEVSQSIYGISIAKIIKIIKNMKETITQQEIKIADLYAANAMLTAALEDIKAEKLELEDRTKTEREQKIDEILKITKKIEGCIDTQTIGSN